MSPEQQATTDPNDSTKSEVPYQQTETTTFLETALETMKTLFSLSSHLNTQLERWMPVLAALQKLAKTSQKLSQYLFQSLTSDTKNTENATTQDALPLELFAELHARFTELTQAFPDVTAFFLDTDKIDQILADILLDPANALPGNRLLKLVNEQITRAIGKFVELTMLSAPTDAPSAEATHAFLKRAEHLLDHIIQRWIWPIIDPTNSENLPDEHTP